MTSSATLSWEDIIARAPKFLANHFNQDVSDKFMEYCEEEEFDDVALVKDDIESWDDSSIIETIAEDLNWTDDQRKKLWQKLRVLCEIDVGVTMPDDMNFDLTDADVMAAKKYMDVQCPGMFGSNKDKVLLQAIAIGLKNDVPLLPLIFDIYLKYRLEKSLQLSRKGKKAKQNVTPHDWETSSKYLSDHQQEFKSIVSAVANYQARMFNPVMLTPFIKFNDSLSEFLKIAINACNMVHSLIQSNHPLPLQVDVWLIPKGSAEGGFDMCNALGDEDSDDEDDGDDGKMEDGDDGDELGPLEDLLTQGKIQFEKNFINVVDAARCQRGMRQQLDKVVNNKGKTRCVMVIDRRDNGPDNKSENNKILTYIPPEKFSKISNDYCQEQLIYHTLKFISPSKEDIADMMSENGSIPDDPYGGDAQVGKRSINGGMDAHGKMCCLSFHIHAQDHVVCYWYVQGWGARFWPSYFIDIWPQFFNTNDLAENHIDANYVKKNLKLQFTDNLFTAWEDAINK
jgi:hypothetical protein